MLEINNIDVYYHRTQVLKSINVCIKENEIVSLIGSNGAGKSTLINTISGILSPKNGSILFLEERIERKSPHEIVRKGVIQIQEGRGIFPRMSVIENLEMGAFLAGARGKIDQNLETVIALFPILKTRANQMGGTLSGGEQQMLAIGRGLMACPKLLMVDEPSLGLAPLVVRNIFGVLKIINNKGVTIFLVEQNVFQALTLCQRGYVIENGTVTMEDNGQSLLNNAHIRKAYLGI